MSRHSRSQSNDLAFPIFVLVGAAAWMHRAQLVHIAYISVGVIGCLILLKLTWNYLRRSRSLQFQNVDMMDGLEFEEYVAALLRNNGFRNVSLTERYDFGVDIIAEKDDTRWGIQAKRHSGLVKADAVRQVVTGLNLYDCDRAMVISNSSYSKVAIRLALAN
ncbi:MAG TPA: restriction endonuclease, partial [Candidatus Saccharimonadales bacterium]|nr:restriction endonuclease [Candidatus Saccharimonadales bacterium]